MSQINDTRANTATSEFGRRFGAGSQQPSQNQQGNAKQDRPKSKFWINVGYPITVTNDDGTTREEFISLSMGIPLDSVEYKPATSSNKDWAQREAAQNHLLDLLKSKGSELQPGEALILDRLSVELRQVKDSTTAATADNNQFVGNFAL
ncbi:ssDNA-binding protein [Stenotrophomonas phage Philippe]|uniref:SsDNA-binding protein n=1 Tax=Stenotrophomonas phage Philippe TaxID=2859655 RepID=A0AAE7WPT7_9CAUD|nr:ssDNA-binding protein [Stenotrophomonas phage Philippe]QYW02213.1 ssDNA-binding protein [Stenotrophomonas phage Philippe]